MSLEFYEKTAIKYWDNLYDQQNFDGYCYRQRMDTVLSWIDSLNLPENAMILDVGCGPGRLEYESAKRGYKVIGLDISHGMVIEAINICNNEGELNTMFLQGNVEALPLKPSSFDVIICLGVVAYLASERNAMDSLARSLKPGGFLAISIVNKARLTYRLDLPVQLSKLVKKILHKISTFLKKSNEISIGPVVKPYLIPKFQKSLELAGFKVIEYTTVPWKLLTFCGKEVYPQKMALKITLFFERFSNIPIVGSFGGMCIFKAEKLF